MTLQHAATVGQTVDKLMSKANWKDAAWVFWSSRVAEAEAHSGILHNDSTQDLIYSLSAHVILYHCEEKRNATVFSCLSFHLSGFPGTLVPGILIRRFIRRISLLSAHGLCDFHVLISDLLARPSDANSSL